MYLKILICCIGIHLNTAQIINHHMPVGHDDSNDNLNWPSLNIIMHVPNENGTLKKVPIYQDPASASRRLQMQQQQQQLNNRNKGGRYYSNHRNTSHTPSNVPVQTEWVMGKPPGVRFSRPPGVDYKNFHPGNIESPIKPDFDWSHRNLSLPAARFNAHTKRNKTINMNMDVAIHPIPDEYTLEHISKSNQSTIMFNHTEPEGGENNAESENLPNFYPSQRRPSKAHRRHRTRLTTNKKLYTGNTQRKPTRNQGRQPIIEEFSGNMAGFTKLLNDSLRSVNINQRRPQYPDGSYRMPDNPRENQYRTPDVRRFPGSSYQSNYEQERQRLNQMPRQMYPRLGRNRFYSGYQPAQRRDAQTTKYPEDEKLFFSGLDSLDPRNQSQSYNYSFGGGQSSLTPIFWDGNSPMNISITQRDPQNNTIFSYTFDPNVLVHPKNDSTNLGTLSSYPIPLRNYSRASTAAKKIYHRVDPFYHPRNKVKDGKDASKIWKSIGGRTNDTPAPNFEPYSVSLDNFESIENNLKPDYHFNQKGPLKISLDEGVTSSSILFGDESIRNAEENSELLGYFPKHLNMFDQKKKIEGPSDESKMNLRKFYSSISKAISPKDKEEMVLTGVDQDENGNYIYQSLETNDRKSPLEDNSNMLLVTPAPYVDDTNTEKSNKYILMQLKKPNHQKSKSSTSDFKSKVEPLIITSIYRQFLTDLKKNESHDGSAKHKLHFSFKLGPGYFNKELVKPKSALVDESFDFDDEKYDSHQYFHDKKH